MSVFMKWGSVVGSATETKHKDWIVLEDASFSITHPVSLVSGEGEEGRSVDSPNVSDIDVTVKRDKATPDLLKACLKGEEAAVTIDFTREKGDNYQQVKLKEAMITKVSGLGGDTASLTVNFTEICVIFTGPDNKQAKSGLNLLTGEESIW